MLTYFSKIFKSTWQLFALFTIALVVAVTYIVAKHSMATTNDARVVTNVVPIASSVSGVVSHINVKDNQFVKQGQSLFELSADDLQLKVRHYAARIAVLTQSIQNLTKQIQTIELSQSHQASKLAQLKSKEKSASLPDQQIVNQDTHDIELLKTNLAQKQILLKEAQTAYDAAKNQMSQLVVTAPTAGYISNFNVHEGEVVKSYHTLFGIIQPAPVWVIANFLETDLARIRPGQPAQVRIAMYPDIVYDGEVESIGYGITPDTDSPLSNVLPTVAPNYSWIKLSQRFPVRIRLHNPDPNTPMRVGANAWVKIHTR